MSNDKNIVTKELNKTLCHYYNTIKDETGFDIKTKNRKRELADLKKIFCYYARTKQFFTLTSIGRFLGLKHETVAHNVKQFKMLYYSDPHYRKKAEHFIIRFAVIDGFSRKQPNKETLAQLNEKASEETRGEWIGLIKNTAMIKKAIELEMKAEA